jgi:methanogenic corrinoid protein MtbC1
LSAATAIPVETIRTWERRYGFPEAQRKPSGHRVYALSAVARLRRVAEAIARGHRAAEVVAASEPALEALLGVPMTDRVATTTPAVPFEPAGADDLLAAVRQFDGERLQRAFVRDWARLGPIQFLEQRATPFLAAVGEAWASGRLDIRHEHFGSACLGDFLRTIRIPLDERARGPMVALATLPGENHSLGLQMASVVFALAGWRVLFLGVETPPEQIVALAREAPLAAVALSLVNGDTAPVAIPRVADLRRQLPDRITLLLGGAAAKMESGPGMVTFRSLAQLDHWVRGTAAA